MVAHPEDETIFAGAALADRSDVWIVHLTDGAPRDPCSCANAIGRSQERLATGNRSLAADGVRRLTVAPHTGVSRTGSAYLAAYNRSRRAMC